jgi:hypothetical protein
MGGRGAHEEPSTTARSYHLDILPPQGVPFRSVSLSRGASHEPLNFLQRRVMVSSRATPLLKRHILIRIRKAKTSVNGEDQAILESMRLWAYFEMLRSQDAIANLDATTVAYKNGVLAYAKLSEVYVRARRPQGDRPRKGTQQQGRKQPPMRPNKSASHEPQAGDVEAA